jgi:hypothetical protein
MNASVSLRTTAAPINYVVEHLQMRRRHISKRTDRFTLSRFILLFKDSYHPPKPSQAFSTMRDVSGVPSFPAVSTHHINQHHCGELTNVKASLDCIPHH